MRLVKLKFKNAKNIKNFISVHGLPKGSVYNHVKKFFIIARLEELDIQSAISMFKAVEKKAPLRIAGLQN